MIVEYDKNLFLIKRAILGISVKDLSDKCGINTRTVNRIERGDKSNKSTVLLVGLVLDMLAKEAGKEEVFKTIENSFKNYEKNDSFDGLFYTVHPSLFRIGVCCYRRK